MKKMSDHDLLEFTKKDNHLAFTELVNRYWQDLYQHVCIKIKDRDEAQDMIQDIYMGLWRNRLTVVCDEKGKLSSYLYKAAKYAVINYFSRPGITITGEEVLTHMLSYPAAIQTDESIMVKELSALLDAELNELPDRLQVPYRLSREQNLSIKEIAANLSVSEQTVKNNISTVLHKLKFRLGKYNSDIPICLIIAIATFLHEH
nr:sigma-70 family RNA polymerase sigma factor [Pedobacter sp. ASV19]